MSEQQPVRFAVVGLGRHGSRYANHLLRGDVPGAQLVAVHRRNVAAGEAFAREHGVRFVSTVEALWEDPQIDAVVVTTPTKYHAPLTIAAAKAGKHVVCEKPLARTVSECSEMIEAARENGVLLTVGQTLRFHPVVEAARQEVGRIGEMVALGGCMRQEPSTTPWHADRDLAGGGVTLELGVHVFDGLAYVSDRRPEAVIGATAKSYGGGPVEDYASLLLEWEGGILGSVDVSKYPGGRLTRYELLGRDGLLIADLTAGSLTWIRGRRAEPLPVPAAAPGIPRLLNAFVAAVRGEGSNPVPPEAGRRAVAVAEAFYQALAQSQPVPIAE